MHTFDALICAALRGEYPAWPSEGDPTVLLERVQYNGVGPLLHEVAASLQWPGEVKALLRDCAVQLAMWEIRHRQILAEALNSLGSHGVQAILFKGTALAYSLYPQPVLRTRGDTDLLIPAPQRAATHAVLIGLGYQLGAAMSGKFVSYQASYTKLAPEGSAHSLDVHWKINNSELLSRLFRYEELRNGAAPLPQVSPHALGPAAPYALAVACMHRATHKVNPYYVNGEAHHSADRLIWLYDIHLLASTLTPPEWAELVRLAAAKGLRAVCLDGLKSAQARFHTAFPDDVLLALGRRGPREEVADYLNGDHLHQRWIDFRALGSRLDQLQFMQELAFPPAAYVRGKYPGKAWLPWLYLRRGLSGLRKSVVRRSRAS